MPQASSAKSTKSGKASKAAKAILHPKSTLAAVKANHSQNVSTESMSTSEASKHTKLPATSIRKTPSSASIASNTAKPLPSAPSASGSPAANTASLPATAPASSVLAPPTNADILSMKKQAIERTKPVQQAPASAPALATQTPAAKSLSNAAVPPSGTATPYAIDDDSVLAQNVARAKAVVPPRTGKVGAEQTSTSAMKDAEDTETFASEVAAVLVSSTPAPNEQPLPETAAAFTPVAAAIVNQAAEPTIKAETAPKIAAAEPTSTSTASANSNATTDTTATTAAASKVATFTPPELTRLQHNTFVSRPTDPSRVAIRDVDPSVLPWPLRPIDRQSGLVRSPSHILIFGWMDAPIRLVAKYAQPYTVLFPDATVLIQLSDGKSYLARENIRREQLQRVISEITSSGAETKTIKVVETKDVGDSTVTLIDHSEARTTSSDDGKEEAPKAGGFVIHSFSDGGAGNLALFLDEMARRSGPSPRVHSLIMDSSPGKSNPKTASIAFTMHMANRPRLRAIVRFFVYIGLYLLKIWTTVTGQTARGELMRKRLNSLRSWSWVTASYTPKPREAAGKESTAAEYPPRMYVYTKADQLIPWQFVEEHANQLASIRKIQPGLVQVENEIERATLLSAVKENKKQSTKEYKVELRRWDTPPHCSIGRSDFEGYWAAVMDFHQNVLSRE
ncbi:uncharacterized protein UTRI_05188_B [Ustilago trichophora]|uniref:Uncharacterized protein n=1 Tax=Ustilago trichophora TaxID=86804 RepID=A0A5C3EKK0_9BASI|nr:uncharacterized protein UTRI_05188_B [Ustilago trichophora]